MSYRLLWPIAAALLLASAPAVAESAAVGPSVSCPRELNGIALRNDIRVVSDNVNVGDTAFRDHRGGRIANVYCAYGPDSHAYTYSVAVSWVLDGMGWGSNVSCTCGQTCHNWISDAERQAKAGWIGNSGTHQYEVGQEIARDLLAQIRDGAQACY
jgi:hypothetical protein